MGREQRIESGLWIVTLVLFALGYQWGQPASRTFELSPRADDALRVATWNVGGAGGGDTFALSDEHLDHVAERVRSLDPDLLCLQELRDRRQLRELQRRLGPEWSRAIAPISADRRVAVLAQRGELQPFDVDVPGKRALGVVYRSSGREVACVALHADAFSSGERNLQIGAALDQLVERGGERPLLFAGDFNLDLDLDKRRDLFTDDEYRDVETYNYVLSELVDAARGSGSTAEPDRRLDYLFHSRGDFEVLRAGPWRGQRAPGMDHHPVVADLRY